MISQEDIDAFKENEAISAKYLILKDDGILYAGYSVSYCDSKKELGEALRSTDYFDLYFPIKDIEVYEVTRKLTAEELLDIKGATNAKES